MENRINTVVRTLVMAGALAIPLSISAAQGVLYLAVFLWLIPAFSQRNRAEFNQPWTLLIGCFLVAVVGSILGGDRPLESLAETRRLFLLTLIFIVPAVTVYRGKAGDRDIHLMLALFLSGTVLLSLYDILRVIRLTGEGMTLADTGNMRDPQFYMVGLCLLLAAWMQYTTMKARLWLAAPMVLSVMGLWLHQKRGAWFSMAGAILFMAGYTRRWRMISVLFIVVGVLLAIPPVRHATLDRLGNLQEEFSIAHGERLSIWVKVAPGLIRDHPFGIGFKSTDYLDFKEYAHQVAPGINHLHDNLLQVAAEVGWFGALAWLVWMLAVFTMFFKSMAVFGKAGQALYYPALGACTAFVALMLNGIVEYNFGDSEIYMLMCLLMGLCNVFWIRRNASGSGSAGSPVSNPLE